MSEPTAESHLIIPAGRVPVAAYQAIYHRLTGRVETITRQYGGNYLVTIEAIEALYYKFDQAISQYQVQGKRCEFTISMHAGENYRFTSLEKLRFSNIRSLQKSTDAVGLELDFLIVLPSEVPEGENIPQRYKVLVMVEDERRIAERQLSRSLLTVQLHEPASPTGSASVSYADYAVGRTVLSVIEEWFSEIEFLEPEAVNKHTLLNVQKWLLRFTGLFPFIVIWAGIVFEPPSYPNYVTPIRYLLFVILLAIISTGLTLGLDGKIRTLLRILGSRTCFDLSGGDKKDIEDNKSVRRKAKARLSLIFIGVLLAIGTGVFVNYISSRLFGMSP